MHRQANMLSILLLFALFLTSCEPVTAPEVQSAPPSLSQSAPLHATGAATAKATGGGQYELELLEEVFPGKFSFSALQFADGRAKGQFRYELDLLDGIPDVIDGGVAAFHGRVTCLSVDLENGRAWVGGVVTKNASTQPFYRDDATTQVGKDIWFRVLDNGQGGQAEADRTTFVGFEGGAGIITSQEYCDEQPWPEDNARTHPVTQGNVQVHESYTLPRASLLSRTRKEY